jgi:hypothetical protein
MGFSNSTKASPKEWQMNTKKWMIGAVAVLVGWSWMDLDMAHAGRHTSSPPAETVGVPSVQTVSPYMANSIDSLNPYSISIYKPIVPGSTTVTDVTTTWLPEVTVNAAQTVTGIAVYVVIKNNGVPVIPTSINLKDLNPVSPAFSPTSGNTSNPFLNLLTTSHYRGYCTNFGPNTDTGPDFNFDPTQITLTIDGSSTTLIGYKLTPNDCGGMAVLQAMIGSDPATFIVPQDSLPGVPADGIPQVYEALYPAGSCKVGNTVIAQTITSVTADNDCTPAPALNAALGDGISNFDEARGFVVSGTQIRTDWRQKDLFFHVVKADAIPTGSNCSGTSLLPASLFDNLNTLVSDVQIHPLGNNLPSSTTGEWVDRFSNYEIDLTSGTLPGIFTYSDATTKPPADDRQINLNALYPIKDIVSQYTYQKGLRITECLDTSDMSNTPLMGAAGWGSANGPDNSVIYTKRIQEYTTSLIGFGLPDIYYKTYDTSGKLTPASPSDADSIVAYSIRYTLAMEIGHSVRLTSTSDNGFHHAPGAGSNMDQSIIATSDATSITFHIPMLYINNDQQNFRLKN